MFASNAGVRRQLFTRSGEFLSQRGRPGGPTVIVLIVVVLLVIALAIARVLLSRKRSRAAAGAFRAREHSVAETEDRRAVESELGEREKRHHSLDIHNLIPGLPG